MCKNGKMGYCGSDWQRGGEWGVVGKALKKGLAGDIIPFKIEHSMIRRNKPNNRSSKQVLMPSQRNEFGVYTEEQLQVLRRKPCEHLGGWREGGG